MTKEGNEYTKLKRERERLKEVLTYTQRCQQMSLDETDYRYFTDSLMELSGAEFVILNLIAEEDRSQTVTRAVSGAPDKLSRTLEILGYPLEGAQWETDYERLQVCGKGLVRYASFEEMGYYHLYPQYGPLLRQVEELILPGSLYVMEIEHLGEVLGVLTLIMPRGEELEHTHVIELYVNQIATTISCIRAEKRYRQLIENLQEGVWIIDAEGYTTFVNEPMAIMLGYSESEMMGKHLFEFMDPSEVKQAEAYLDRRRKGVQEQHENQFKSRDGRTVYVTLMTSPIYDEDGAYAGAIAGVQDITDRKKMEKALYSQKSHYEAIFKYTNDAIAFFDGVYGITHVNDEFTELFGYDPSEVIGQDINALLVPEAYQDNQSPQILTGETVDIETVRLAKGQRPIDVNLKGGPVIIDNKIVGGYIAFTDISDRKRAEEKLSEYTMELELKNLEVEELYNKLNGELNEAKKIHERTLPYELPRVEGLTMTGYYQPAEQMGGDFYNVSQKGDKLIFYVSDVTGHGLEGALVSAFVKEAIDSYINLRPEAISPEEVMRHLDQQYRREDYPDDYFISFFLCVLDLNTLELSYTGAGFQESMLVHVDREVQYPLTSYGPPISATLSTQMMNFESKSVQLQPGSTVMLNTDGLTEQEAGGNAFLDRKDQVFYTHSHLPPEFIKQAVNKEFLAFNGSLQGDDDITYIILQVAPETTQRYQWELASSWDEVDRLYKEIYPVIDDLSTQEVAFQGVYELVINAIEHGNQFYPKKKVLVEVIATDDYLLATVEDEGEGFDWESTLVCEPDAEPDIRVGEPDTDLDRGRGLVMTGMLCDCLLYNNRGNKAFLVLESRGCSRRHDRD